MTSLAAEGVRAEVAGVAASVDFVHWHNLDSDRPYKQAGIEIDTGGRVRPCMTPDDAQTVRRIIAEHAGARDG